MGEKGSENRGHGGPGRGGLRIPGDEAVELAWAGGVRFPRDHVLAGAGPPDLEQDPVRGISRRARPRGRLATPDAGALADDDSGGARTILARRLRPLWQGRRRIASSSRMTHTG